MPEQPFDEVIACFRKYHDELRKIFSECESEKEQDGRIEVSSLDAGDRLADLVACVDEDELGLWVQLDELPFIPAELISRIRDLESFSAGLRRRINRAADEFEHPAAQGFEGSVKIPAPLVGNFLDAIRKVSVCIHHLLPGGATGGPVEPSCISQIPEYDEHSGDWCSSGDAAMLDDVKVGLLRKARSEGVKSADSRRGVGKHGRVWRDVSDSCDDKPVIVYHRPSLRKKP